MALPLQTISKPSLQELMARRAGPKKLQEVRVNPAIASTMAALGSSPAIKPQAAAAAASGPAGPSPQAPSSKPALTLAPPPAAPASPAKSAASPAGGAAAQLGDLLGSHGPAVPASQSPLAASSGSSSPWSAASPAHSAHPQGAFDPFVSAGTTTGEGLWMGVGEGGRANGSAAAH